VSVSRIRSFAVAIAAATVWAACTRARQDDATGAASLGAPNAPVLMIYYTDFECDECRAFAAETLPMLRRRYVDTGRLRIVVRELSRSERSLVLASACRCAGEFGKYWELHDSVLAAANLKTDRRSLGAIASAIGVPTDPFARCVESGRYATAVRAVAARAARDGISRGASLLIGRSASRFQQPRLAGRTDVVAILDSLLAPQ
jgi:hypothetical protein